MGVEERWKEIVEHYKKEEVEGVVINEKVAAFRKWFSGKPRTPQEIDEYWGKNKRVWGQNKKGKRGTKTTEFLLWLNEKPRTKAEVAEYWRVRKR